MLGLLPSELLCHSELIPSPNVLSHLQELGGDDYLNHPTSTIAALLPTLANVLSIPLFMTENVVTEFINEKYGSYKFVDSQYENLHGKQYFVSNCNERIKTGKYFALKSDGVVEHYDQIMGDCWPITGWPQAVVSQMSTFDLYLIDLGGKELPPKRSKKRKERTLTMDEFRKMYLFPTAHEICTVAVSCKVPFVLGQYVTQMLGWTPTYVFLEENISSSSSKGGFCTGMMSTKDNIEDVWFPPASCNLVLTTGNQGTVLGGHRYFPTKSEAMLHCQFSSLIHLKPNWIKDNLIPHAQKKAGMMDFFDGNSDHSDFEMDEEGKKGTQIQNQSFIVFHDHTGDHIKKQPIFVIVQYPKEHVLYLTNSTGSCRSDKLFIS